MNSELNDYKINNPDGADKIKYNEVKKSYDNDKNGYIKENSAKEVNEAFDGGVSNTESKIKTSFNSDSVSKPDVSSTASASNAITTSASTGGMSTLVGAVASVAATTAIVVAVFISTLVINLTLAMSGMHTLVFQIEMVGAQEEDFKTPIVAILEGDGGYYAEQEIFLDTVFITFDDLESGKEYIITIKNDEKVFVKKSYFTATEEKRKGSILAAYEQDEVFVSVEGVKLNVGEFYTITAKDDKGNVVYKKDDVASYKEFSFKYSKEGTLYFTLSVNGTVYAVDTLEIEYYDPDEPAEPFDPLEEPSEYDYDHPIWTWERDGAGALTGEVTLSFLEIHGGESVDYKITANKRTRQEATCETCGISYYYATTSDYGDEIPSLFCFSDDFEDGEPLGHDLYRVEDDYEHGDYTYYQCMRCDKYFDEDGNEIDINDLPVNPVSEYENVYLSLDDGKIVLYADGYTQNGSFTAYENTENNRYVISGSRTDDTPLKIHTKTHNNEIVEGTVNFYLDFSNATIKASSWSSALVVAVFNDINIDINNYGSTTINPYNHPAFSIQGNSGFNVNISWTNKDGGTFTYSRQDRKNSEDAPALYKLNNNTVLFTIDGKEYDVTGNEK